MLTPNANAFDELTGCAGKDSQNGFVEQPDAEKDGDAEPAGRVVDFIQQVGCEDHQNDKDHAVDE